MMRTLIQAPRPSDSEREPGGTVDAVDLDALGECLGYRVDDPNGRVGTVDGIVAGAWTDRPDAIEVRVGLFRQAILMVPTDAVAGVHQARRRVILRESVDLADAYSHGAAGHPQGGGHPARQY
jgi:hypothetical protein